MGSNDETSVGVRVRYLTWLFIGSVAITAGKTQSLAVCDVPQEKETERCLAPMISFANSIQSQTILPFEGHKVFETMCQLYSDFHGCIFGLNCQSQSIDAIEASYGYMCGEAYSQFVSYIDCFVQVEESATYKKCKSDATTALYEIQYGGAHSPGDNVDRLCYAMQNYLRCSKPTIFEYCDANAWTLIAKATRESLKITMPNCSLEEALRVS